MKPFFLFIFCIWIILPATSVWACASCGSGVEDPLILYPNERLKMLIGVSQTQGFRNVNPDGSFSTAAGPRLKQTLNLAVGLGLSLRSFVTLAQPFIRNIGHGTSRSSCGDPSLAGRYTLILQSMDQPLMPQLQLLYSYKHALARSLRQSRDSKTLMDVFGSGFSEVRLGVDLWFGMTSLKPGFAVVFAKTIPRSYGGIVYEPGSSLRSTLSLGYNLTAMWRLTVGINREEKTELKKDGRPLSDSAQLNHSAFISTDIQLGALDSLRLTANRQAALAKNFNSSRSNSLGLAYLRSF